MIVVAERLIPGDCFIQPCRLIRFLIVDGAGSQMGAGTGLNDLAVQNIDIPTRFVVLRGIAGIAQRQAEVDRILSV